MIGLFAISTELQCAGFDQKAFRCKIAELTNKSAPKQVVGYAMYFPTYSSWEGRSVMLQDLYVRSSERRRGIGERLFNAVAKVFFSVMSPVTCSRPQTFYSVTFYRKLIFLVVITYRKQVKWAPLSSPKGFFMATSNEVICCQLKYFISILNYSFELLHNLH